MGIPSLSGFTFDHKDSDYYKTLITQEMLKNGFLAGSIYACTEHSSEILKAYFDVLDPIFGLINSCQNGLDINSLLDSSVCHNGFKRLN